MVKCISIFSGAGGLDIGAVRAGADIVVCIENDEDAAQTLRQNIVGNSSEIVESDIQSVCFKKWRCEDQSILIGGPPCQPFSKNGYWVKNNNRRIENDPRNLLGQFLRALDELKPKGFLFENVESIRHPTNRAAFERFVFEVEQLGYAATTYKANSADFGVPQKRKRVFVLGVRGTRQKLPLPRPTHGNSQEPCLFCGPLPHVGVGSFIVKYEGPEFSEPEEDPSAGTYFEELTHVPAGCNYIALSKIKDYSGRTFKPGTRFWNFLQKLHPEKPSITIAAHPGPWVGPFHWANRRLRVPEIAAIQTFPDGYRFHGNRRSIQRQIGNAVPCLLGEKMVAHLLEHL